MSKKTDISYLVTLLLIMLLRLPAVVSKLLQPRALR